LHSNYAIVLETHLLGPELGTLSQMSLLIVHANTPESVVSRCF